MTFRTAIGIIAFGRIRSYLSTMQKQGYPLLPALAAVFHGHSFPAPGDLSRYGHRC